VIGKQNEFTVSQVGERWPSGNYVEVAVLSVDDQHVSDCFSTSLLSGEEEGMGPWRAIGIRLNSGELIELIKYDYDESGGFILRTDGNANKSECLEKVIELLEVDEKNLTWISPLLNT
jgi:hypothetical protein